MDDVEDLVVPDDLAEALDALPGAREQWDGFSPSSRKQAWPGSCWPSVRRRGPRAWYHGRAGGPRRAVAGVAGLRRTATGRGAPPGRPREDGEQRGAGVLEVLHQRVARRDMPAASGRSGSGSRDVGDEEQPGVEAAEVVVAVGEVVAAAQHPHAAVLRRVREPHVGVGGDQRRRRCPGSRSRAR